MDCMAGLAKLWMALSAQVLQKKNEKHSQTEGSFRKAMGCSCGTAAAAARAAGAWASDRKSTRLNSSHSQISYAVFCLKKKKNTSELESPTNLACRLLLDKNR